MADSTIVKTAGYSFQRRDETATPLCGAHRIASHAKNPLLVKAQLGAVKATTYSLPEDFQHEYGLRQERDGVTAGDVVDNWADNDGSHSAVAARDFRALNKAAISSGHLDVKAMNEYRNEHDIRVKLGNEKGRAARGGGNYDDNTAFGRPTRPSTPFGDLVSHGFRYDWVMQSEPASAVAQSRRAAKAARHDRLDGPRLPRRRRPRRRHRRRQPGGVVEDEEVCQRPVQGRQAGLSPPPRGARRPRGAAGRE